jgi:hypothetical protein
VMGVSRLAHGDHEHADPAHAHEEHGHKH